VTNTRTSCAWLCSNRSGYKSFPAAPSLQIIYESSNSVRQGVEECTWVLQSYMYQGAITQLNIGIFSVQK